MFVQGYVTVFLCLCDLCNEERHKATTRNCVPQGMGRARHIPSQTGTVVMFVQGDVTVFLRLCDSGRKERHKATTVNCVPHGRAGISYKLMLCIVCLGMGCVVLQKI